MVKSTFITLIFFLLFIPFCSAQISIGNYKGIYNLGDEMKIYLSIHEQNSAEGIVSVTLKCDSYNLSFYANSIKLSANEIKEIIIEPLKLTKEGVCRLNAEFKNANEIIDSFETEEIIISNKINITIEVEKPLYKPGEELKIFGRAVKANGQNFKGTGKLDFDGIKSLTIKEIFVFSDTIDRKIKSGKHVISITVSDENGNYGATEKEIEIIAIPTSIEIKIDKEEYFPNDNLTAIIKLLDQAGDEINESLSVVLYNTWGHEMKSSIVNNGVFEYEFESNAIPGDWWIYSYSSGIKERKFFYVNEVSKIDVELVNNTLRIKNIGNVDYTKALEITFISENENTTKIIIPNIWVGKEESFKLKAPDGNYKIIVKSGNLERSFNAFLTGNVITIENVAFKPNLKYITAIIFIVLVILFSAISRYKIGKKIKIDLKKRY